MADEPMETDQQNNPDYILNSAGLPEFPPLVIPAVLDKVASYEPTGPRLLITHITNEYFKSYAGVQVLGPFHKSFSSIIGPNGSGKSNVIDSMLFVFGYRAKKIRSSKISVLIHNSEQHKNVQSCSVAVHFQKIIDTGVGDDDYTIVPDSKFVVSRTAFKDNSSYYKVNDKKATYKEVAVLLRSSGIDLDHNRFLILQGEVEQIAMMKPKALTEHEEGMLEFLEDIIGSSRYKEPIEILSKRVEILNEMRGEKLNRVKAVEKEKDELEGSKNEAVQYLSMENDITKLKNKLYQKYIADCTVNEKKATDKKNEILDGMKEVTQKLEELTTKKKEKGQAHKKIHKHYDGLSKKCDEKKEEFSAFEQQDIRCREDLKHSRGKLKKLEKSIEQEKKKLEELNQIPDKVQKDTAALQTKQDKLEGDKAVEEEKLKEVMDSLKTETQELQEVKEKKERELLTHQKGVNDAKSKRNVAQSEVELFLSNLKKEEANLRENDLNLKKASKSLEDRQAAIKDLEKRIPETTQSLQKAEQEREVVMVSEEKLSEEVRSMRQKVAEGRSSLSASSSKGKVLDSLMAQKKSNNIPGIYGRLGDLGAIDDKYDVAISTACGGLDNVVVDTINTAQKCVEFLKKNNIGSATFIGLDKMERWKGHCDRKIQTPENVPRLFDLITVKDKTVLPAFYFALRDTLVANNLDHATKIAYGKTRFRVVTLNGQLIDTSGTMSGGGKRVMRGRMSSRMVEEFDPKELDMLEQKLQSDTSQVRSLHERKISLEQAIAKDKKLINELKHNQQKFSMEIKQLVTQVSALEKQYKDQELKVKNVAIDPKELKKMEANVEQLRTEHQEKADEAKKIEDEVHKLHRQIMDIGGTKLKSAESKVNVVSAQIDQIMGQITKAKVNIKNAERNAKKTADKVDEMETDFKDTQSKIEKLEEEFKKLEDDATKVLNAYQEAQDEMKKVEEELNALVKEIAEIDKEEDKLQKDSMEVKYEIEKYDTVIKDNSAKIKYWKKEIGKLAVHTMEDLENCELKTFDEDILTHVDKEDSQYEITILEEKLAQMKPNMAAIAEYKKKEEMYLKRVGELESITEMRDTQRKQHEDLRKSRLEEFMYSFGIITNKLKEMYQMITLGGDAELELVDSLDPFSEGIVFSVRPPKKSWKNISNLSGGEKTLSSLALVFALHHFKPTPLYVMDEIDAALDFKNVSIVANYIKERTKNAQFIIISLRNNMFELADRLIGIYKTYNATKTVTINPKTISFKYIDDPSMIEKNTLLSQQA